MINLNSRKNVALIASAGTGKTFNLSLRYINLLLNGAKPEQILCLTFTVKATMEMQERIFQVLNAIADGNRADFKNERAMLCNENNFSDDELEEKVRPVRDYVLKNFSQMQIRTIDSFVNRIISQFPFEAKVRPGFNIIQDKEKEELEAQAFLEAYNLFSSELKGVLSSAATAFGQTPKSLIEEIKAQQGSFENQLVNLPELSKKYKSEKEDLNLLIETITNSEFLAKESVKKFGNLLLASTLNGHQKNQANSFLKELSITKIMDTALFAECNPYHGHFKNFNYTDEQSKTYDTIAHHIQNYLSAKGELLVKLAVRYFTLFFDQVERLKRAKNVLSFADITMKAYEMLVENKIAEDTDYLYFRLDGRILHILVDEFQDTSLTQWQILEPLVEEALAGVGQQDKEKSFFYVGDPKQTLYRFRGGESRLFDTVTKKYLNYINEEKLSVNFRSSNAVVDFTNELFLRLTDETFKYTKQSGNSKEKGFVSINFIEKDTNDEYVLKCVQDLLKRGFRLSEIAVLTETNNKANKYTEYLNEHKVPARSETKLSLADTAPFKIITNIFNHILFKDTLSAFSFRMADPAVNSAEEAAKAGFIESINSELKCFEEAIEGKSAQAAFYCAVNTFFLAERFENDPNFKKLCDITSSIPTTHNLMMFMDIFRRKSEAIGAVSSGKSEAVTVMTIHKSKGLEFEAVVLSDLEIRFKPDARNTRMIFYSSTDEMLADRIIFNHGEKYYNFMDEAFKEAYMSEEKAFFHDRLNLLYVAVTRAKRELFIPVKEAPSKNTLEELLLSTSLTPKEYGSAHKKSFSSPVVVKRSKTEKFQPFPVPEYPITEETTDLHGEIFGSALHQAIALGNTYETTETEDILDFVLIQNAPFLSEEDGLRIKKHLDYFYNDPFFKKITENAEVFKERGFFDDEGMKVIDFYSVSDNAVYCLDFKTGEIKNRREEYEEQIKNYGEILFNIYKRKVEKYIVNFVSGNISWIEVN